ncbi:hypothetical protein KL86DES1_10521 [uncultured Desulfovibrio sp.]|uniref:Uncharacterized protein n=1 Tax=uncultured Desulfovibrio sp. TaxID=167968 RepID=A0A212KZ84_9BACT|nr:hypothetical protein KL86DES1_10521 [uncultured Desulfovibrio sp.]VZH32395.1 conserved protein of unknown function [Desulfovibrio sp. 86]
MFAAPSGFVASFFCPLQRLLSVIDNIAGKLTTAIGDRPCADRNTDMCGMACPLRIGASYWMVESVILRVGSIHVRF